MGKADIKMNECLKDTKRYADCFNTATGSSLISPNELVEMERILEGSVVFPKTTVYYKKERDTIRGIRSTNDAICAIVCIENQTDIHYAEAANHLIYDAYNYNKQLTDIRKKHEELHEEQYKNEQIQEQVQELSTASVQVSKNTYSYRGFSPDDRLLPVLTVCVYYGEDPWNAPTSLTDLMDFSGFSKKKARLWKKYIQNYKIIVLDIRRMSKEQIEHMTSDLKLLFGMLKYADDKDELQTFIHQHEDETNHLKKDLADAFSLLSGTAGLNKYLNKNKNKGGETVKMCKAINDMIKEGETRGEARGEARGETKGRYNTFIELLKDNLISLEEAAKRLNMSEETLRKQL